MQQPSRCEARRADCQTAAQPGTRISCHAALDEAARAPFSKERRMKFAKATNSTGNPEKGWEINLKMIRAL
jgi:hypothetical protein